MRLRASMGWDGHHKSRGSPPTALEHPGTWRQLARSPPCSLHPGTGSWPPRGRAWSLGGALCHRVHGHQKCEGQSPCSLSSLSRLFGGLRRVLVEEKQWRLCRAGEWLVGGHLERKPGEALDGRGPADCHRAERSQDGPPLQGVGASATVLETGRRGRHGFEPMPVAPKPCVGFSLFQCVLCPRSQR